MTRAELLLQRIQDLVDLEIYHDIVVEDEETEYGERYMLLVHTGIPGGEYVIAQTYEGNLIGISTFETEEEVYMVWDDYLYYYDKWFDDLEN